MEESIKLDYLIETLLSELRKYGIAKVSMEQYQVVCNSILRFATRKEVGTFSDALMAEYTESIKSCCDEGDIWPEYLRFQMRVIRMLKSLFSTGNVDFSAANSRKKYKVI